MICEICGAPACQHHHVFGGANRKHSDKYKLISTLCLDCHNKVTDYKINPKSGVSYNIELKQRYQRIFEAENGSAEFRRIFGKSYL